jgi:uncharacterized protein YcgI (DUF1989 family)
MQSATTRLRGGCGVAVRIARGQHVKVINTHGKQVVDTWAFNAGDMSEFTSMEHTRSCLEKLFPAIGDSLYSNRRRPILTVVEDTSPGVHDTLHAACDVDRYRLLGHKGYHANCADNLRAALGELGLGTTYIPAPFNMFERVVVTGGQNPGGYLEIQPPLSMPGDYLLLRAELDHVIVVLSACPQDMSLTNGLDRTPKDVEFQIVDRA